MLSAGGQEILDGRVQLGGFEGLWEEEDFLPVQLEVRQLPGVMAGDEEAPDAHELVVDPLPNLGPVHVGKADVNERQGEIRAAPMRFSEGVSTGGGGVDSMSHTSQMSSEDMESVRIILHEKYRGGFPHRCDSRPTVFWSRRLGFRRQPRGAAIRGDWRGIHGRGNHQDQFSHESAGNSRFCRCPVR